jgi:hypothetical protein
LDELNLLEKTKCLTAVRFRQRAQAELTAGLLRFIGPDAGAGLKEHRVLSVTFDVHREAVNGATGADCLTAAWLRDVVDRLAMAVAEEADAAARAAQDLAAELGQACLKFERAEYHRLLEAAREAAEEALAAERETVARLRAQLEQAESREWIAAPELTFEAAPKPVGDAPRYASMLVSEITRYYEAGVAGIPDGNTSNRISGEIERSRRLSSERASGGVHSGRTLRDDALLELLGGDDAEADGRLLTHEQS